MTLLRGAGYALAMHCDLPVLDLGAVLPEAVKEDGRGFHSSTFQLNLRRSCHSNSMKQSNVPHNKRSRQAEKWTSVSP